MAKYENDVRQLLTLIGGKENIQAVSHCMTRMRFVLVDSEKADEKGIEKIPSVKGTFTQAGQYQVIIGTMWLYFIMNLLHMQESKESVKTP